MLCRQEDSGLVPAPRHEAGQALLSRPTAQTAQTKGRRGCARPRRGCAWERVEEDG